MAYLRCGCFSWLGTQDGRQLSQDDSHAEQNLQQMDVVMARELLKVLAVRSVAQPESVPVQAARREASDSKLAGTNFK